MIQNREFVISKSDFGRIEELPAYLEKVIGGDILRWYISRATADEVYVEATISEGLAESLPRDVIRTLYPGKSVVLSIIPTGIGCDIGGYAADAAPATALLASCTDYLVTNPNAVNASNFISMPGNVLYTEGFMIDMFSKGLVNLYKTYANKVGLIIESTSGKNLETVFNIINTARAVHGIDIEHYVITPGPIGGRCEQTASGSYVGRIDNPGVLFEACEQLIRKGVNAIAVTSNIQDLPMDNYAKHFDGKHPNPVGGAEAVISHLICSKYKVPAAHAPMINVKEMDLADGVVDARGAGEFASVSGLACVLIGLGWAPQIAETRRFRIKEAVNVNNLAAVVAPASALGGIPVLYAANFGIPVIAVRDNNTILDVTRETLNLSNVMEVNNYAEAAGVLQALRTGISIESLYRPLETLRPNGV
jgi:hypothetical protein